MRQLRDHKAEYRRRIEAGRAKGLSRSQARGHPRGGEIALSGRPITTNTALEPGLKLLRQGHSLSDASRQLGVSRERLGAYVKSVAGAQRIGRAWAFSDDRRRRVPFIEGGLVIPIRVAGYEPARRAGDYWEDAHRVLREPENAEAFAHKWQGLFVRDAAGQRHFFTTDLNEIYRAAHANDAPFEQIYRLVD